MKYCIWGGQKLAACSVSGHIFVLCCLELGNMLNSDTLLGLWVYCLQSLDNWGIINIRADIDNIQIRITELMIYVEIHINKNDLVNKKISFLCFSQLVLLCCRPMWWSPDASWETLTGHVHMSHEVEPEDDSLLTEKIVLHLNFKQFKRPKCSILYHFPLHAILKVLDQSGKRW